MELSQKFGYLKKRNPQIKWNFRKIQIQFQIRNLEKWNGLLKVHFFPGGGDDVTAAGAGHAVCHLR